MCSSLLWAYIYMYKFRVLFVPHVYMFYRHEQQSTQNLVLLGFSFSVFLLSFSYLLKNGINKHISFDTFVNKYEFLFIYRIKQTICCHFWFFVLLASLPMRLDLLLIYTKRLRDQENRMVLRSLAVSFQVNLRQMLCNRNSIIHHF